jgi:hypothetical protein
MQVLSQGALARGIEAGLLSARLRLLAARLALDQAGRLRVPQAINRLLNAATHNLRSARSELADPATLPSSYRN